MDKKQTEKELILDSGVVVSVHYMEEEQSLSQKMVLIFSTQFAQRKDQL